jgi:hypothetical protein
VFKTHSKPIRTDSTPRFLGKTNPKRHKPSEPLKRLPGMPIGQPGLEPISAKRERESTRRISSLGNTSVLNQRTHRPLREAITTLAGRPRRRRRNWAVSGTLAVGNEDQTVSGTFCEVVFPPWAVLSSWYSPSMKGKSRRQQREPQKADL